MYYADNTDSHSDGVWTPLLLTSYQLSQQYDSKQRHADKLGSKSSYGNVTNPSNHKSK